MNNKDKGKTFFKGHIRIYQILFGLHRRDSVDVYKHSANCNLAVIFWQPVLFF